MLMQFDKRVRSLPGGHAHFLLGWVYLFTLSTDGPTADTGRGPSINTPFVLPNRAFEQLGASCCQNVLPTLERTHLTYEQARRAVAAALSYLCFQCFGHRLEGSLQVARPGKSSRTLVRIVRFRSFRPNRPFSRTKKHVP